MEGPQVPDWRPSIFEKKTMCSLPHMLSSLSQRTQHVSYRLSRLEQIHTERAAWKIQLKQHSVRQHYEVFPGVNPFPLRPRRDR